MKKWLAGAGVLLVVLVASVAIALWLSLPGQLPGATANQDACARYGAAFDLSSVTSIYQEPEAIVSDPARFWAEDAAYRLVAMAPAYRGTMLPPDGWLRNVERVVALPDEKRAEEVAMARSREIMAHVDTFCQEALPVIASLLPAEADLGTTVRLTALNDPAYFAYRSSLVMNTDTPAYLGRTSKFFNILGHEMLHIGYFDREPYQAEVWSEPYPAKVLPMVLQNDGLAVYTQYLLSSTYRAPLEIELVLLKNKLAVSFLIGRVNELLQEAGALPEEEILGTAYRGLSQRALYVVGAHMARTIDETLGRAALAETVRTGPRSFIRTYNRVAEPGQEIHEIPEPEDLSAIQVLRKAALAGDLQLVEEMIGVIGEAGVENPGGETFEPLVSAGLVLQRGQAPDLAVAVFELLVSLFPEHAEAHVYLGDAYSLVGEPEKARGAYQRAAEIDVRVAAARQGQ